MANRMANAPLVKNFARKSRYFGSVAKRCGRDNSIYHPLGVLCGYSLFHFILYNLLFFQKKVSKKTCT